MSATLLDHAALHAAGLALAAALAWLWTRSRRRDPESNYRLLNGVLIAALCLPLVQLAVEGRGGAALRAWLAPAPAPVAAERAAPAPPAGELSLLVLVEEVAGSRGAPATPPPGPAAPPAAAPVDLGRALLALWLAGVVAMLAWQLLRVRATQRTLAACHPVADPDVLALWRRLAAGTRWRTRARLLEGPHLFSPGCFGLGRRPAVVVPTRALRPENRAALECALLHELVHLERRDAWLALLESAARTLFWFHPAVWWIARELDALRESTCDLQVVRRTGRPRSYALALLTWALGDESEARAAAPTLLHWTHSPSQLRRRIEMLTNHDRATSRLKRWSRRALTAGCLGAVWSGQIATAALLEGPDEPEPTEDRVLAEIVELLATDAAEAADAQDSCLVEIVGADGAEAAVVELRVPGGAEGECEPLAFSVGGDGPVVVDPGPGLARFTVVGEDGEELEGFAQLAWSADPGDAVARFEPAQADGGERRLGVHVQPVDGALAAHLGLEQGLTVTAVEDGSAAERAGFRAHDVIVGLPGGASPTASNLQAAVRDAQGTLRVEILRRGREKVLEATLGASTKPGRRIVIRGNEALGLDFTEIEPRLLELEIDGRLDLDGDGHRIVVPHVLRVDGDGEGLAKLHAHLKELHGAHLGKLHEHLGAGHEHLEELHEHLRSLHGHGAHDHGAGDDDHRIEYRFRIGGDHEAQRAKLHEHLQRAREGREEARERVELRLRAHGADADDLSARLAEIVEEIEELQDGRLSREKVDAIRSAVDALRARRSEVEKALRGARAEWREHGGDGNTFFWKSDEDDDGVWSFAVPSGGRHLFFSPDEGSFGVAPKGHGEHLFFSPEEGGWSRVPGGDGESLFFGPESGVWSFDSDVQDGGPLRFRWHLDSDDDEESSAEEPEDGDGTLTSRKVV